MRIIPLIIILLISFRISTADDGQWTGISPGYVPPPHVMTDAEAESLGCEASRLQCAWYLFGGNQAQLNGLLSAMSANKPSSVKLIPQLHLYHSTKMSTTPANSDTHYVATDSMDWINDVTVFAESVYTRFGSDGILFWQIGNEEKPDETRSTWMSSPWDLARTIRQARTAIKSVQSDALVFTYGPAGVKGWARSFNAEVLDSLAPAGGKFGIADSVWVDGMDVHFYGSIGNVYGSPDFIPGWADSSAFHATMRYGANFAENRNLLWSVTEFNAGMFKDYAILTYGDTTSVGFIYERMNGASYAELETTLVNWIISNYPTDTLHPTLFTNRGLGSFFETTKARQMKMILGVCKEEGAFYAGAWGWWNEHESWWWSYPVSRTLEQAVRDFRIWHTKIKHMACYPYIQGTQMPAATSVREVAERADVGP